MSDDVRKDEDTEVEAHNRLHLTEERAQDEADDEVEAHMPRKALPRKALPRKA